MTVRERLIRYLKGKKISQAKFAETLGVSSGYVNAIRISIQPDKIQKIKTHYPDLNTDWLLTGEGQMLKEETIINPNSNLINEKDMNKEIERLKKMVDSLHRLNELLESENQSLKSQLNAGNQKTVS